MTLPPFVAAMAEELRRLPCRVDHDKAECKRCTAIKAHDEYVKAYREIVQVPGVPDVSLMREPT
jgi:hypothetical protein